MTTLFPGSTSSYSSQKIEQLFNTLNNNSFITLQNDDKIYNDFFKYNTIKGDNGKITFEIIDFNSAFSDTTINFNNKFNDYDVVNISGVLTTPSDEKYTITCNVENLIDSFNNLTNSESTFELTNTKNINNCFNSLQNVVTIPSTTTSIINSFNNLDCSGLTFTIEDSSIIDIESCFTNCSMNIVCLEYPLLLDVSTKFENCSGDIVVFTNTSEAPTHGSLNVVTIRYFNID